MLPSVAFADFCSNLTLTVIAPSSLETMPQLIPRAMSQTPNLIHRSGYWRYLARSMLFLPVLTQYQIDQDLVRKQLIINQAVEQTVLMEDRGKAIAAMKSTRLTNVKQIFSQNNKRGTGLRLNYGYGGNLAQNYIPEYQGVPRMKTDIEYQIA